MGVDVAACGKGLSGQVVGAGVVGLYANCPGEGGVDIERCDADGVGDQLGLGVQDLLAGVDLVQWQAGRHRPVGALGAVQVGFGAAEVCGEGVVGLVGDQDGLAWGGGWVASRRAASVRAMDRS